MASVAAGQQGRTNVDNMVKTPYPLQEGFDRRVVLTNGFVKKTQKTPTAEIELAKQRRTIYLARMETEEGKN